MGAQTFENYGIAKRKFATSEKGNIIFERLFELSETWTSRLTEYSSNETTKMDGTLTIVEDTKSVRSIFFFISQLDDFERYPEYQSYDRLIIEYYVPEEKFFLAFGNRPPEAKVERDVVLDTLPAPDEWKQHQ